MNDAVITTFSRIRAVTNQKYCSTKQGNETKAIAGHTHRICPITTHCNIGLVWIPHRALAKVKTLLLFTGVIQTQGLVDSLRRRKEWMRQSQWEKDRVRRQETTVPLPAAKVAETRLFQGISIPHHDRKSLPQTEPIKIWSWIKISKACQMASPHHGGLSAVDASSEGDEECLILIHPQQREGGVFSWSADSVDCAQACQPGEAL